MKRIIVPLIFSLIILAVIFAYQSGTSTDANLHIVFCDVGQGDAIYIRTPGGVDILIDGGLGDKVLQCLFENMPLYDKTIELVFATHPDSDHITGLVAVLNNYSVKSFATVDVERDTKIFKDMMQVLKQKGIKQKFLKNGDNYKLSDGVELKTFWPSSGYEDSDTNNHSLVQLLSYREFDALMTGDVSYQILNSIPIDGSDIEIFKLPHHGSKTGIDSVTMAKIDADLAIISAGANNPYHHPHPSVISLLNGKKMPYLETSKEGSIKIVSNGHSVKIID